MAAQRLRFVKPTSKQPLEFTQNVFFFLIHVTILEFHSQKTITNYNIVLLVWCRQEQKAIQRAIAALLALCYQFKL